MMHMAPTQELGILGLGPRILSMDMPSSFCSMVIGRSLLSMLFIQITVRRSIYMMCSFMVHVWTMSLQTFTLTMHVRVTKMDSQVLSLRSE